VNKPPKTTAAALRLFDPRRGDVALKVERLRPDEFTRPQRFNYFTVLCLRQGHGTVDPDLAHYDFKAPALMFFNPYQTFFITPHSSVTGTALQFHANFFCIETHHQAVGCNGVLFNEIYGRPLVPLQEKDLADFNVILTRIDGELRTAGLAHSELLVSYLKIFLIQATRLKVEQQTMMGGSFSTIPPALHQFTELLEKHYREKHSPGDYARLLHMAPKTLGQLAKVHFGRTPTEIIRERLLKHAKWQLLHTLRPVKEIAHEVGFNDELYFSRLFHRATGCSPTAFREFETAIRGGRNLSM
jgi:AraC family transcriptional activator of pobA